MKRIENKESVEIIRLLALMLLKVAREERLEASVTSILRRLAIHEIGYVR
jgi:hypothetical protein